jgi:pyridoxine 5'-phosphate synthase PdxJ
VLSQLPPPGQAFALDISRNSKLTDAALKELAGLKELRELNLGGTKVTHAGVAELQKALPGCKITH